MGFGDHRLRDIVYLGGRVLAVILGAVSWALNLVPVADVSGLVLLSAVVFVVLTASREYELYLRPRPRVEFMGLAPATRRVDIRYHDEYGNQKLKRKTGRFQWIFVQNCADESAGDQSVAKALTGEVSLFSTEGHLEESWIGRWSDLPEAENVGQKWELDRIDLHPNGQRATLDIGVSYEGESGFFRWDNSRYVGDYNAQRWADQEYEIRVIFRASNMTRREFRFRLINEECAQRLVPMSRKGNQWSMVPDSRQSTPDTEHSPNSPVL